QKEAKSSYYKREIILDGFSESKEYQVTLYTVSRGEKRSEPLSITIHPETPPVQTAYRSLHIQEAFGGVSIGFSNESEADLAFHIFASDDTGFLQPVNTFYTKLKSGYLPLRGYD